MFCCPADPSQRNRVRRQVIDFVTQIPTDQRERHASLRQLQSWAREVLSQEENSDSSEIWEDWVVVLISNELQKKDIAAVPFDRRLVLLPHCMKNRRNCTAQYDSAGCLLCRRCGSCPLGELSQMAEDRGCQTLIAEGSPVALQRILANKADCVLGVACMDSLKKAFTRLQTLGLPALAAPLFQSTCLQIEKFGQKLDFSSGSDNSSLNLKYSQRIDYSGNETPSAEVNYDLDWIRDLIDIPYVPAPSVSVSRNLQLLRQTRDLFSDQELGRLLTPGPEISVFSDRSGEKTHEIAREFVLAGGKFLRPYLAVVVWDSCRRELFSLQHSTSSNGNNGNNGALGSVGEVAPKNQGQLSESIKCLALAIEAFHKASLIHDDIEDNDPFRYGKPTVHRQYGIPTAINSGDYLLGWGYELLCQTRVPGLIPLFSRAHRLLALGQGAELLWKRLPRPAWTMSVQDILRLFALKTAPAFEAALIGGLELAIDSLGNGQPQISALISDRISPLTATLKRFCRQLGVGFQIQNDLDDWFDDAGNKKNVGSDIKDNRPTILNALARQAISERSSNPERSPNGDLDGLTIAVFSETTEPEQMRAIYESLGVFEWARTLRDQSRDRALVAAQSIDLPALREAAIEFVDLALPF